MERVKRKLLVLAGLGGLAAFAYKKFVGGKDDTWESSYEPTDPFAPESQPENDAEPAAEEFKPEPAAAAGEEPSPSEDQSETGAAERND